MFKVGTIPANANIKKTNQLAKKQKKQLANIKTFTKEKKLKKYFLHKTHPQLIFQSYLKLVLISIIDLLNFIELCR